MILVDTNVWSELVKATPAQQVRAWEHRQSEQLWLSTVVIGEFLSGVAMMPEGKRRAAPESAYEEIIALYADRIVSFDLAAARLYGTVLAFQEQAGRDPGTADTQIAATALARGMSLATRNTKHFEDLGLRLIDPWHS
jgi:predicted nucleic acid-binding protein